MFCLQVPDEMIQCIVCEDWFHGRVSFRSDCSQAGHEHEHDLAFFVCVDKPSNVFRLKWLRTLSVFLSAFRLRSARLCGAARDDL